MKLIIRFLVLVFCVLSCCGASASENKRIIVHSDGDKLDLFQIRTSALPSGETVTVLPFRSQTGHRIVRLVNERQVDETVVPGNAHFAGASADGTRIFMIEFISREDNYSDCSVFVLDRGKKVARTKLSRVFAENLYCRTSYPDGKFLAVLQTDGTAETRRIDLICADGDAQHLTYEVQSLKNLVRGVVVDDSREELIVSQAGKGIVCFYLSDLEHPRWTIPAGDAGEYGFNMYPLKKGLVLGSPSRHNYILFDRWTGRVVSRFSRDDIRKQLNKPDVDVSLDRSVAAGQVVILENRDEIMVSSDMDGRKLTEQDTAWIRSRRRDYGRVHPMRIQNSMGWLLAMKRGDLVILEYSD